MLCEQQYTFNAGALLARSFTCYTCLLSKARAMKGLKLPANKHRAAWKAFYNFSAISNKASCIP